MCDEPWTAGSNYLYFKDEDQNYRQAMAVQQVLRLYGVENDILEIPCQEGSVHRYALLLKGENNGFD